MADVTKAAREDIQDVIKVEKDNTVEFCYLVKGGWYYRPGAKGYTSEKEDAGVFTKKEALRHAYSCHGEVKPVPVKLEDHNRYILDKIVHLSKKMLTPDQVLKY